MMVSMLLEDMLSDLGCIPVGPAAHIEPALAMAGEDTFDFAILDVNLNGKETYVVADALARRAIPFVFASGYGAGKLPEKYRKVPALQKPFQQQELERTLTEALKLARAPV